MNNKFAQVLDFIFDTIINEIVFIILIAVTSLIWFFLTKDLNGQDPSGFYFLLFLIFLAICYLIALVINVFLNIIYPKRKNGETLGQKITNIFYKREANPSSLGILVLKAFLIYIITGALTLFVFLALNVVIS